MMHRSSRIPLASTAFAVSIALANGPVARAQDSVVLPAQPRTTNERVVTQTPTPPPANSDALRAAEGKLAPGTPNRSGAIDPARALGTSGPAAGAAMDPAMRLDPAARSRPGTAPAGHPAGMDAALMVEHALGMAIDGSALRTIGELSAPGAADPGPSKRLLEHANKQMMESQRLLGQAAADAPSPTANPGIRRFQAAANYYISTLGALETASPAQKAEMAMLNHAVKEVLEADHVRQMVPGASGSPALDQLMKHAADMKAEGTQVVARLAGNAKLELNAAPSIAVLALRARDLLEAAEQLPQAGPAPTASAPGAANANPTGLLPNGPNPAAAQDDRARIIGGSSGTGSPSTGTTRDVAPATARPTDKVQRDGSPVPTPPNGTSNGSNGGLRPR